MAPPAPLRIRFPLGCRVAVGRDRTPPRLGTVVGYARVADRLWVQLDGRRPTTRTCYPVSCLRRLPADPLDDEIWYDPLANPYRAAEV